MYITPDLASASVVRLAERGAEVLQITELEPACGTFIGKRIERDGSISPYPKNLMWWRQSIAVVPANIPALFAYLSEARKRNIILIRGAPADIERRRTRRQKAGQYGKQDRGSHGFGDAPTKLFPMDVDGVSINWRDDPERAVRAVVEMMGEPWASTSYVWFFSATHGLEFDAEKRWTGNTCDGALRVRLMFITDRPLDESEAVTLTLVAKSKVEKLDRTSPLTVQPNYIKRPLWIEHPDRDPLGDIPTIGRVTGARETLAVPNDLTHKARWAQAQGHSTDIADHPNALTAVRAVGSDGRLREHLKAVVWHLLRDNPIPDLRRQVTEGALVQTGGRARAGLRGETDPLDLNGTANGSLALDGEALARIAIAVSTPAAPRVLERILRRDGVSRPPSPRCRRVGRLYGDELSAALTLPRYD